ncbi:MAG TPA: DUF2752 domain-containing protein [Pyrinomonadaceae bacterium]|nr:DUF2752 domain-containing protein [Pyrinomonadaceae bacterium]
MEPIKSSLTERVLAAAGLIAGASGAFAVAWFNPVTAGFFPQCPLYQMTGLACPGCGLTRGFHALFHGDILTALDYNVMLPFYVVFFVYLTALLLSVAARGRGFSFRLIQPKIAYGFLIISLVFGVARNLPFYPFTILYP